MGLNDRLKGLSQHKIEQPPPAPEPVVVFDQKVADRLLVDINDSVGAAYVAGCLEWIIAYKADVWTALCEGENSVDAAYLAGDMPRLVKAVDLLQRMYLKAFELFKTRPPIVEVQPGLAL